MSYFTPVSFAHDEWAHRQTFVRTIEKVCAEAQISIHWLSEYWVGRMEKHNRVQFISGYHFPLNTEAAAVTAKDKVSAYEVLREAAVPVVAHWLVRFPPDRTVDAVAHYAFKDVPLPLVVKPCNRGGGRDVHKVTSREELIVTLTHMAAHYQTIASSPFEEIIDEYRVVMLDRHRLLMLRKQPVGNEWRHNLHFGATPAVVEDQALAVDLEVLAAKTLSTLGLRFAAVDIITTATGLKVMEVNTDFGLNRVAHHPELGGQYEEVYRRAVKACFA